jgi:peptidoglycan hydrolase-like amidase/Flp pilus assembly protein TadD
MDDLSCPGWFAVFLAGSLSLGAGPVRAGDLRRTAAEAFAEGDLACAEQALEEAFEGEEGDLPLLLDRAAVREEADDPEGAWAWYSRAVSVMGDPRVLVEAAAAQARCGGLEGARSTLESRCDADPEDVRALWYAALVHRALARRSPGKAGTHWAKARERLEAFVSLRPEAPEALLLLGECAEALGDASGAVSAYESALRADSSLKSLHARLARLHRRMGDADKALERFERAVAVAPGDADLAREKRVAEQGSPERDRERRETRKRRWTEHRPLQETPLPPSPVTVRVGLETGLRRLVLRSGGALSVTTPAGTPLTVLAADQDLVVVWEAPRGGVPEAGKAPSSGAAPGPAVPASRGSGRVLDAAGKVLLTFDQRIWFAPTDSDHTVGLHALATGSGYFFASEDDRFYRGVVEIHPGPGPGFNVVNHVALEGYVAGVLPSEMPASWPLEALKAQAVAARTESLAKAGRHNAEGFDVCDEVHCQAYGGLKAERNNTNRAVAETRGLVLWRKGRPFPAVYSAQCGGSTQSYQEAWGYDLPVPGVPDLGRGAPKVRFPLGPRDLKGWVEEGPDAYCRLPGLKGYRQFRWLTRVTAKDLEARERLKDLGPLRSVRVLARSSAGWVRRVRFVGEKGERDFTGDSVRGILGGIRSNLVWLEPWRSPEGRLEEVWIHGGGWGHGVGMCQAGAFGRARDGAGFKDILKHYYPKASFKKLRP